MKRPTVRYKLVVGCGALALVAAGATTGLWYVKARQRWPLRVMRQAVAQRDWVRALVAAEAQLKQEPTSSEALLTAARCHYHLQQWMDVDRYFSRVQGRLTDEDLWMWCEALGRQERWDEGLKVVTKLYERHPDGPRVLRQMCVFASESGQDEAAMKLAQKLASFPEHQAVAYGLMGSIHQNRQQYAQAAECLAKALELDPSGKTLPESVKKLKTAVAWSWMQMGQMERAYKCLVQALSQYPDDGMILWMLGKVRLAMNDPQGAYGWWIASLHQDPSNPDALFSIGKLEMSRGRVESAVNWLQLAARNAPGRSEPRQALGTAYARLGMLEQARAELEAADRLRRRATTEQDQQRLARLAPQSADGLRARASRALKAGKVALAITLLKRSIETYNDGRAKAALDTLLAAQRSQPGPLTRLNATAGAGGQQ